METQTTLAQIKISLKDIQWRWIFGATFAVLGTIQIIMFLIISIYVARNSAAGNTLSFHLLRGFQRLASKGTCGQVQHFLGTGIGIDDPAPAIDEDQAVYHAVHDTIQGCPSLLGIFDQLGVGDGDANLVANGG